MCGCQADDVVTWLIKKKKKGGAFLPGQQIIGSGKQCQDAKNPKKFRTSTYSLIKP